MSLVMSGIATFVQCCRFGLFSPGLLSVRGTSVNVVGPLIAGGTLIAGATLMRNQDAPIEGAMPAIFGVVVAGAFR